MVTADMSEKLSENVTKAELALALEYVRGYLIKLAAVQAASLSGDTSQALAAMRNVFVEDEQFTAFVNRFVEEQASDG
jgi:glucosamine 6-phosphate synthetase-like amidotransferase/phosphosugar isomerase protein